MACKTLASYWRYQFLALVTYTYTAFMKQHLRHADLLYQVPNVIFQVMVAPHAAKTQWCHSTLFSHSQSTASIAFNILLFLCLYPVSWSPLIPLSISRHFTPLRTKRFTLSTSNHVHLPPLPFTYSPHPFITGHTAYPSADTKQKQTYTMRPSRKSKCKEEKPSPSAHVG